MSGWVFLPANENTACAVLCIQIRYFLLYRNDYSLIVLECMTAIILDFNDHVELSFCERAIRGYRQVQTHFWWR